MIHCFALSTAHPTGNFNALTPNHIHPFLPTANHIAVFLLLPAPKFAIFPNNASLLLFLALSWWPPSRRFLPFCRASLPLPIAKPALAINILFYFFFPAFFGRFFVRLLFSFALAKVCAIFANKRPTFSCCCAVPPCRRCCCRPLLLSRWIFSLTIFFLLFCGLVLIAAVLCIFFFFLLLSCQKIVALVCCLLLF